MFNLSLTESDIPRINLLGEVMVELSAVSAEQMVVGVAGDTFNTAVALSQLGMQCDYVTALGSDSFSNRIRQAMHEYGLSDAYVATVDNAAPGLYAIETDSKGERSFTYWRDNSAARQWLSNPEAVAATLSALPASQCFYWSGITLALMSPAVREYTFEFLTAYRARGGVVVFDSNYRSVLWSGQDNPTAYYDAAIAHADLYLPSLEDEQLIHNYPDEEAVIKALRQLDCEHVVLTLSGEVVWINAADVNRYSVSVTEAVDTTGAGDAFSGGLIAALCSGKTMPEAIGFAHRVASDVVLVRGAILPKDYWDTLKTVLSGSG